MKKVILSDADGCLVNWQKGFEEYMINLGHSRAPGTGRSV